MQSTANKIWDEITTYEAKRKKFMEGLAAKGLYNPETDVDPTTLSQHLTLDSEPDAIVNLEIKNNSGDWITATENGLLTIANGADKSDLDAMGSKRGWTVTFKHNAAVNDPFIRLTFKNLRNSHYDDGTNAVPIDEIVETFSNVNATNGDPAQFIFANDPTRGWWYNHCSGVTATIQLYREYDKTDENGNPIKDKNGKVEKEEKLITFNQPVYMSVSSLNSGGEHSSYKESAQLESYGEAYRIPESSVIADGNKLYSPYYNNWYLDGKKDPDYKDSDYYDYWGEKFEPADWHRAADEQTKVRDLGKHIVETYKGWDNPDQYNRIFGSGLYKVNGDRIKVRSYVGGSTENQSISKYNHVWFAYSTLIPETTFDAKYPVTTISYHFAKARQNAQVIYRDISDPKNIVNIGDPDTMTGKPGETIVDNNVSTRIDDITKKGYVLSNNGFPTNASYDNNDDNTQTFYVDFKHGTITVTPDKPGNGLDQKALTKTVTETVNYVVDGGEVPAPAAKDASLTFNGTAYYDAVTKKWTDASGKELTDQTKNITWTAKDGHQFGVVVSPEVKGYHVAKVSDNYNDGNGNVKAINGITENSKDITVTVNYTKNPVVNDQNAQVIYRDISDPKNIVNIGDPDTMTGKPGETIVDNNVSTRIDDITKKGYVLSNNGFPTNASYDNNDDNTQTFYVDFKHGIQPVGPEDQKNPNQKPGKPGDPINPDDPDKNKSPKYPVGSDVVTKDVTENITYEGLPADQTPAKVTKKLTFNGYGYLDKVTGKWVDAQGNELKDQSIDNALTWTSNDGTTFAKVTSPYEREYHIIKVTSHDDGKGSVTAIDGINHDSKDINITVTYAPNGHIVPVTPDPKDPTKNKEIPGVDHPVFPTDPADPTKVDTNRVPNVPDDYQPKDPSQKPGSNINPDPTDPGKNVPVVFVPAAQDQNATLKIVDQDDKNPILGSYNGAGKNGTAISFNGYGQDTVQGWINKGYEVVGVKSDNNSAKDASLDGTDPNKWNFGKFDDNDDVTQAFTITLKHGTTSVDPKHPGAGYSATDLEKTVTRTINYLDGEGNSVAQAHDDSFKFTASGTVDKVTGKLVSVDDRGNITGAGQLTWNAENYKFDHVDSPTVLGMHVTNVTPADQKDGDNVKAVTVTKDSSDIVVDVYYAPNGTHQENAKTVPSTQTVKIVDDQGNELRPSIVDSFTFSRTPDVTDAEGKTTAGQWNATEYTYGTVDAPVIPGYVAEKGRAGGKKATTDNPNVVDQIVYHKVSTIIPVTPDHKPIPNAPQPEYPNDPQDPTNVKPNEPIPNVPGYTPVDPSPITPQDPTKPTYVIYTKDPEPTKQGSITVKYHDTTDNVDIPGYGTTDQGNENDPFTYDPTSDLTDLEDKGYVVDGEVPKIPNKFSDIPQTFVINVKHGTITVTPDKPGDPEKPINPNDPDPKSPKYPEGTTKNDLTKDSTQTITYHYSDGSQPDSTKTETINDTFTKTVTVDKVTGKIVSETPWTGSHTFDSSNVPVVNGYHSDKKTVGGKTATVNNPDVTDTVTYTPNGKIIPVDPSGKPIPNVPTPTYPTDPNDPTKVVPNEPVPNVPGMTPETPTVTPADPTKDTPVVYNPIPNVPGPSVGPSDNTPTPVTPTPGKTTEEKKPDENKDDKDVDEPDDDEDVVPTPRHHKKHNGGESSTTRPRPTGYTPAPRGSSYLDANGKVHYKLPQTGESDSEEMAAVLGGAAATIGLIGLAGAKKRRHE